MSTPQAAEFERHLAGCADCRAELLDLDLLRGRFQLAQFYEPAPASLRRRIHANFSFGGRATGVSPPLLWHWLAAAAALLSLAILLWRVTPSHRKNDYQVELAEEIVNAHQRSLQPDHPAGVVSNDDHVVKKWFEGTLKFAVPVPDFANEGFALQSGRVEAVEGRPFAALMYVHDGHLISLFYLAHAGTGQLTPHRITTRLSMGEWRKASADFCTVSDINLNLADLKRLQGLIAE